MGLLGGLKKIGKGIGRGVKKIGRGIDKFDDMIKLKELASIGQFIPGVNVIAKPLSMAYSGYDLAKGIKDRDLGSVIGAGINLAGSHGIKTGSVPTGGGSALSRGLGSLSPGGGPGGVGSALSRGLGSLSTGGGPGGVGSALSRGLGSLGSAAPSFGSRILSNLGSFAGGAENPLGQLSKLPGIGGTIGNLTSQYQGLGGLEKAGLKTLGSSALGAFQGGGRQPQGQPQGQQYTGTYSPATTPLSYATLPGGGMETFAQGGIAGDWHEPINMLPPNYEGWVDKPSIATLGESGTEAVLPLNKLVPAMRQGGLNYSPGQALVGEAGPEYITGLQPDERHWAQSVLDMPAMQTGGLFNLGNLGKAAKFVGKRMIPGLSLLEMPFHMKKLYEGQEDGKKYGWGDFGEDMLSSGLYAIPWAGLPLGGAYDYSRGEFDELGDAVGDLFAPDTAQAQMPPSMSQYSAAGARSPSPDQNLGGPNVESAPGFTEPPLGGQPFNVPPAGMAQPELQMPQGIDESQLAGVMQPELQIPQAAEGGPLAQAQDILGLEALDNENARYWKEKDPERYQAMVDSLIEASSRDEDAIQDAWKQTEGPPQSYKYRYSL